MASGYSRFTPVKKAGSTLGRAAHHTGTALRRSHGAAGKAAYLSAARHVSESGLVTDYRGKFGVEHSALVLPGGGTCDRQKFWNAVDAHPTQRETATVARDTIAAFPHELTFEARKKLAHDQALWMANTYQVAVDFGMHLPEVHKGTDERNFHCHFLISERTVSPTGELGPIQRRLNQKVCRQRDPSRGRTETQPTAAKEFRENWKRLCNAALAREGHAPIRENSTGEKHRGSAATRLLREQQQAHERTKAPAATPSGLASEISSFIAAWKEGDRLRPAEATAELADLQREVQTKIEAASKRIDEIQKARKVTIEATASARLGCVEEFQHDWMGATIRSLRRQSWADAFRRQISEINRNHRLMRDATKEEAAELKQLGRARHRLERYQQRLERTAEKVVQLDPTTELLVVGKPSTKARFESLEKAVGKVRGKSTSAELEIA